MNLYTEFTGPSGSGKSYYLKSLGVSSYKISYIFSPLGFFYCFASPVKILFLVSRIFVNEKRFAFRGSLLLSVFSKLGFLAFKRIISFLQLNCCSIVDEGVSHIPYILMLDRKDLQIFYDLFFNDLNWIKIRFRNCPADICLLRLSVRGHRRFSSLEQLRDLTFIHSKLTDSYVELLKKG